jgi:hypothetical protein
MLWLQETQEQATEVQRSLADQTKAIQSLQANLQQVQLTQRQQIEEVSAALSVLTDDVALVVQTIAGDQSVTPPPGS